MNRMLCFLFASDWLVWPTLIEPIQSNIVEKSEPETFQKSRRLNFFSNKIFCRPARTTTSSKNIFLHKYYFIMVPNLLTSYSKELEVDPLDQECQNLNQRFEGLTVSFRSQALRKRFGVLIENSKTSAILQNATTVLLAWLLGWNHKIKRHTENYVTDNR